MYFEDRVDAGRRLIISGKRDEEKREEGERYFTSSDGTAEPYSP
ncbi:hypothetical protein [Corallococcus exercitus]|nr:hypothetical protein [Corallococcus exercitus]